VRTIDTVKEIVREEKVREFVIGYDEARMLHQLLGRQSHNKHKEAGLSDSQCKISSVLWDELDTELRNPCK
jgi:hypothetical protein